MLVATASFPAKLLSEMKWIFYTLAFWIISKAAPSGQAGGKSVAAAEVPPPAAEQSSRDSSFWVGLEEYVSGFVPRRDFKAAAVPIAVNARSPIANLANSSPHAVGQIVDPQHARLMLKMTKASTDAMLNDIKKLQRLADATQDPKIKRLYHDRAEVLCAERFKLFLFSAEIEAEMHQFQGPVFERVRKWVAHADDELSPHYLNNVFLAASFPMIRKKFEAMP